MGNLELPVRAWQDDGIDTPVGTPAAAGPATPEGWSPDGLLGGLDLSNRGTGADSLSLLLDPKDIADINSIPTTVSEGAVSSGPVTAPGPYQRIAMGYDGACQLPDGSLHPYSDAGGGYANVYGGGKQNTSGQAGVGAVANGTAMPTLPKPGGISGGGKSGPVTSPASSAARDLTGSARLNALEPLTGTASVGGSIGRAIPFLGTPLMFLDFMDHYNAPVCTPVPDPNRIY